MVLPVGLNIAGSSQPQSSTASDNYLSRVTSSTLDSVQRIHNMNAVQVQATFPYVDFVILNAGQRYMVRCNRKAILENSEELTKIIQNNPASQTASNFRRGTEYNHFQISNVDPEDFEALTRYLETKFIRFRDINHIIRILQLSDRFICTDLCKHCIIELDLLISSDTVLEIYSAMSHFRNMLNDSQHYESSKNAAAAAVAAESDLKLENGQNKKKSSKTKKQHQTKKKHIPVTRDDFGAALLNNALEFIDMHAEFILTDRKINNLAFQEFSMIIKRNTLQVSSETVVYNCLADWSVAECARRELLPSPANRRQMLGPLCYAPHYLLMTVAEFEACCARVELLDPTEMLLIKDTLQGKKIKNLSNEQLELLQRFRTTRPMFAHMPVHLSDRSDPRNYPRLMRRAENNEESCLQACGLNCLSAFICIFD